MRDFRHFLLILLGQSISQFGSRLTGFVLGVWVYQTTGSATLYSLMTFCVLVPELLILPFAGAIVDRFDRRWVMILADSAAGVCTLVILYLVWSDQLSFPLLCFLLGVSSMSAAFQGPAFSASVTLLVPEEKLTRANGMVEVTRALAMMTAPPAAGFLITVIDLSGIILIDVTTFLFAVSTLLLSRIPRPVPTGEEPSTAKKQSLLRDALVGWGYIRQRQGLLALLLLFAGVNFAHGMVELLLAPLVLSFASAAELGTVMSIAVLGAVLGGVGLSFWNPRRRVALIFACLALQGMILFVGGARPSVPFVATAACVYMLCNPIISACARTILQARVAPEIQGRVFAACDAVAISTLPLSFLLAGPLVDYVFEPMMAPGGLLADSVGAYLGVGPGRGIGLLFICLGFLVLAVLVPGYAYRPLREFDQEPGEEPREGEATSEEDSKPLATSPAEEPGENRRRRKTPWARRLVVALVGTAFLLALVAAAFGLWFRAQLQKSLPVEESRLPISVLTAEVGVTFDDLAIPTIRGEQRLDVAIATGFLHAQNRFFQMDLQRRRAAGELSELFGEVALPADRPIRAHRFRTLVATTLAKLPPAQREMLDAYTAGVNAGLKALGAKPFEYILLRSEPQPWRPEDSLLVALTMFVELNDESGAGEVAIGLSYDLLPLPLADFLNNQGTEWDAPMIGEPLPMPPIPEADDLHSDQQAWNPASGHRSQHRRSLDRRPPVSGSNSWAVSGEHTDDGRPLLAVDMHLPLSVPNIWYRASFAWPRPDGGEHFVTGITLPGLPVMVLGSNGDVAWGFTALQGDVGDVILLESDPDSEDSYRTPEGPRPFERHQELLVVKGGDDELLEVVSTQWGPVVGKDSQSRSLAFRWTAYEEGGLDLGIVGLETARGVEELLDVANRMGSPGLNVMAVDRDGHIGWSVAGRLPARVGFDGRRPTSCADGNHRWEGLLPPEEIPRIVDPESGRLWSANNRAVDGEMLAKLGDGGYVLGARAGQIRDSLFALDAATEEDMLNIQLDDRAPILERWRDLLLGILTPEAVAAAPRRAEMRRLVEENWSGRAEVDSASYLMVVAFRSFLNLNVFESLAAECIETDEQFIDAFEGFQLEGPIWRLVTEHPPHLLDPRYESWKDLKLATVDTALDYLTNLYGPLDEARWGRHNMAAIHHPLAIVPGLGGWLNMPAEPLPGGAHTPRFQRPDFGASQRMVVSPGREDQGIFHMPGGQSGHPSSPHYRDGHDAWVKGLSTPFLPGAKVHDLLLVPASI